MLAYPLIIGTPEIIAIVAVVLLLFGGKKIPELMKGLGKGVKSFKEGMNEVEKEINEPEKPKSEENNKEEK
jgi:sec-independent protein translocase protein TatA